MNKLLTVLDVYLTALLPYMFITTLTMICMKALGYVSYSWLTALSPALFTAFIVGAVNFLTFILDKLDNGGKDGNQL